MSLRDMKRRLPTRAILAAIAAVIVCSGLWPAVEGARPAARQIDRYGSRRDSYAVPEDALYKSPVELKLSRDGRTIFVSCENSGEVLVVDAARGQVTAAMKTGREPFGLALSPDEKTLFVSNRGDNTVSVLDLSTGRETALVRVGDEPHGVALDSGGAYLYVANLGTDNVSVVDARAAVEVKRLEAGRSPFGTVLSPDGRFVYVSNQLSRAVPFRTAPVLELTVIDTQSKMVVDRRSLVSTAIAQSPAVSPDGRFVIVPLELPKNLLPETQVFQGWMVTHGFAIAETAPRGRVAYLLLDEPNLYFADPFSASFSPDGRQLYVTSERSQCPLDPGHRANLRVARGAAGQYRLSDERIAQYARSLGLSAEYVSGRIATENNPKGLACSPDGRRVLRRQSACPIPSR